MKIKRATNKDVNRISYFIYKATELYTHVSNKDLSKIKSHLDNL